MCPIDCARDIWPDFERGHRCGRHEQIDTQKRFAGGGGEMGERAEAIPKVAFAEESDRRR